MYASRGNSTISFSLDELTYTGKAALASSINCHVNSIWDDGAELGPVSGRFSAFVQAGDVKFVVISGCDS